MRLFDKFPEERTCPVCNSNEVGKCFLIPIHGTGEGYNYEAQPVHYRCLNDIVDRMFLEREGNFIYAKLGEE